MERLKGVFCINFPPETGALRWSDSARSRCFFGQASGLLSKPICGPARSQEYRLVQDYDICASEKPTL
jgi:hypothetical protein